MDERNLKISLERAKELYKNGNDSIKELLLGTFTKEELEYVKLPNTWGEWVKQNSKLKSSEAWIDSNSNLISINDLVYRDRDVTDSNLLPTKDHAEAILTLIKLIRLRDTYRQGEVLDWSDTKGKYCIVYWEHAWTIATYNETCVSILSFQSSEIAHKFLDNFREDIEKLKCLL